MPPPLKVLFVGPKEAGKTSLVNYLSEHVDRLTIPERYQPTIGVRILEMERNKSSFELWDVSGDQIYESCWPAIVKDSTGVVLVYHGENPVHESEAMLWYEWFIQNNASIDATSCLVLEVTSKSVTNASKPKFKAPMNHLRSVCVAFDNANAIKNEFDKFLLVLQDNASKQTSKQQQQQQQQSSRK